MTCEFLFNYKFLSTRIPNFCGYYKKKCFKQCDKFKDSFNKGKDEWLKYLNQPESKETIDFTKDAYELYWSGTNPNSIKNLELKEKLIQIINSEERANENWREYVK